MDANYFKRMHVEKPTKVDKGWGYELHIVNNDMYCGKILHFNEGGVGSLHFHLDKQESWYILKGCIRILGINPDTAEEYQISAHEGDVINIPRGVVHQVTAVCDVDIMEVSTPDVFYDNYRVKKGDGQK